MSFRYVTGQPGLFDQRDTRFGIHERLRWYSLFPWPGDRGGCEVTRRFDAVPPRPKAGLLWTARVTDRAQVMSEEGASGGDAQTDCHALHLRCVARPPLRIGGLRLPCLQVTAETPEAGLRCQEWLYLIDLGFGIETRRDGSVWDITAIAAC